ncbi:hypothetical protein Bca4012_023002 [Brassica carinata]|uniref:Bifunctional inhibitor/plant lipid transfer protein/seed storage helical domain-containing protein n=1 Tax=Brassica carinata TaxID=52824 RepID=A0A8X7P7C8_BRACI|nr:hypothetical protein Bca52824_092806 [Brassica carinata]
MANKLFLVSATLAFFFLLTSASVYKTVVEVDEDDAANPAGTVVEVDEDDATNQAGPFRFPRCRREFRQAQHLRACQQWLHKQARQSGGGPSWTLDGEFDFEDDMENQQGPQQRPPLLQQCCNELHQEEPLCVCPTLKGASRAVRQQIRQQGQQQGQQGQQLQREISRIYQTATHLPRVCNIPRVSICPFRKTMPGPSY